MRSLPGRQRREPWPRGSFTEKKHPIWPRGCSFVALLIPMVLMLVIFRYCFVRSGTFWLGKDEQSRS